MDRFIGVECAWGGWLGVPVVVVLDELLDGGLFVGNIGVGIDLGNFLFDNIFDKLRGSAIDDEDDEGA